MNTEEDGTTSARVPIGMQHTHIEGPPNHHFRPRGTSHVSHAQSKVSKAVAFMVMDKDFQARLCPVISFSVFMSDPQATCWTDDVPTSLQGVTDPALYGLCAGMIPQSSRHLTGFEAQGDNLPNAEPHDPLAIRAVLTGRVGCRSHTFCNETSPLTRSRRFLPEFEQDIQGILRSAAYA